MAENIESFIPLLACSDIAAEHDFLVNVLGFESGGMQEDDADNVVHGEVCANDMTVYLHALSPEHRLEAPAGAPNHGGIVVFVDDVDAHYDRVLAAGVVPDSEPVDQPYGQREYGVTDSEGHRWWIATRL
jgi:PhnB protein